MKVRILLNLPKTIDGKPLGPFTQGQELDIADTQARLFIASAMAEEVLPEPAADEPSPATGASFKFSAESPASLDRAGYEALSFTVIGEVSAETDPAAPGRQAD